MESSEDESLLICSSGGDHEAYEDSYIEKVDAGESQGDRDYTILMESDIRRRQNDAIASVSSVLYISKGAACLILRRHNWSPLSVYEEWFASEERVRKAIGLNSENATTLIQFSSLSSEDKDCGICFDGYSPEKVYSAACGHPFCEGCWKSYIRTTVSDGPRCLDLRCPEPSCGAAAVGLDMIETLADVEDREKYDQFLLRSYVEENKRCRWCPAPGCVFAVEYDGEIDGADNSVTCNCSHSFCWNCTEESHRSVGCEMVASWMEKNTVESDNTRWILAFTKPCPKCKRPIEKNSGCNRMTCRPPCGFVFCWLCLREWEIHGYESCNGYRATKESRNAQEIAQKYLTKYTHYYERWASNGMSAKKALSDLQYMESQNLGEMIEGNDRMMIRVVVAAWKQIIECRKILRWSYVYGYYLPETEIAKKQLFEYLQGQAESGLERLHRCAERGLNKYLRREGSSKNLGFYRSKIKGLTTITRNYFENLARGFENGLSEVDSHIEPPSRPFKRGRSC